MHGDLQQCSGFSVTGHGYIKKEIISRLSADYKRFDLFTQINFLYPHAVATIRMGKGVKAEGELIIGGTKGYIYVPPRGGNLTTLNVAMKIRMTTNDIFTN